MDRNTKEELVATMHEGFTSAESVVVAEFKALSVIEMNNLRNEARKEDVSVRVTKNRLTRLALKDTPYEGISDQFSGQTIMLWSSKDPVSPAKVLHNFAKTNDKLAIKGGGMGENVLDEAAVKSLASMPSLDELRGKIVATISAPAQKIAAIMQAPARDLIMVNRAYGEQG